MPVIGLYCEISDFAGIGTATGFDRREPDLFPGTRTVSGMGKILRTRIGLDELAAGSSRTPTD